MASAQHAHGDGPGVSHGSSVSGHGATGSSAGSQATTSSSPNEVLTRNTKLGSTLSTNLHSKNLLPAGTDLKSACSDSRNPGQCVAAIHVRHNLNITFAYMKADMTGRAPPTDAKCPVGTRSGKMGLNKSIQALAPNTNSKEEATEGTKKADSDLKEAQSTS